MRRWCFRSEYLRVQLGQGGVLTAGLCSVTRLRKELVRLVTTQSVKGRDAVQQASYQSTVYETVLSSLTVRVLVLVMAMRDDD